MCPLSPPLLGISINNDIYIDISPPFGCCTSALACARTTRAIVWLLQNAVFFALCYLDDFVGIELSKEKATQAYKKLLSLTDMLGLALAIDKCTLPCQSLVWLSFNINTINMTVTLPEEKIEEILLECAKWKSKSKASH